jgi:hypothetical protein
MSKTLQFFMDRPHLVERLPVEMQQLLLEAVREQLAKARGGGIVPQSVYDACAAAVPTDLIRAIVADNRRGVSEPSGWLPPEKVDPEKQRGSGWVTPPGLEGSVPGVKWVDEIAKGFDQRERMEEKAKFVRRI